MENNNANYNAEIDLGQVKQKVQGYIGSINDRFFDLILFIKRNIVILLILFVVGAGLGTYMDSGSKSYTHKLYVLPNFDSVDYLYEQVDLFQSKIKKGDKQFIASLGIKPNVVRRVEIDPVIDIYEFINKSDGPKNINIDIFKIMSENGEIDKIVEDKITSRNYDYHVITITTSGEASKEELIKPFLKFLNANPYLKKIQEQSISTLNAKIQQNDSMIVQIDKVVEGFGKDARKANPSLLYYNDNTNLSDLFNIKNGLLTEQGKNRIKQINYQSVIKEVATVNNINVTGSILGKMKVILPLFILFIYSIVITFRNYYRRQLIKRGLK
ncbi:hypothetical protein ACLI1A_14070 [Flavobacterium sp. RHBU_3]|uniref:hypothetical protein n=1 Tax=Flavobacterium sp. RHBU_3 TaxID=3391184 RepID=UPI00398533F3